MFDNASSKNKKRDFTYVIYINNINLSVERKVGFFSLHRRWVQILSIAYHFQSASFLHRVDWQIDRAEIKKEKKKKIAKKLWWKEINNRND